jgi:hypothetical protein
MYCYCTCTCTYTRPWNNYSRTNRLWFYGTTWYTVAGPENDSTKRPATTETEWIRTGAVYMASTLCCPLQLQLTTRAIPIIEIVRTASGRHTASHSVTPTTVLHSDSNYRYRTAEGPSTVLAPTTVLRNGSALAARSSSCHLQL